MNKTEFVQKIAEKTGSTKKDAAAFVDAYAEVITEALKSGDKVAFPGFGTYEVRERAARTGRNPATGETIQIAASKSPAFNAGKALKDAM